jgi:alkanesulfonate monooxygenase SsuD/methylene tetrahydromethanopterin reductase-like flavin-dependent oxidoreductase (luciferase family)
MIGGSPIPIGVNLTTIGVTGAWWIESARRLEAAGFRTAWAWDHFVSRGRLADPMLECWTLLASAAVSTERLRVGSFVTNVMNRHPAVLARMVATVADLSGGRVELGIGIGGHPAEHHAYGIEWPAASERAARLEEAVAVLRLLLAGGPASYAGRFYSLDAAHAFPAPQPPPRILIAGETTAGARLGARIGDAWTCMADVFDERYAVFLQALAAAGRRREEVAVLVGVDVVREDSVASDPLLADLAAGAAAWRARGADELVLHWVRPPELEAVLAAGERAGLRG